MIGALCPTSPTWCTMPRWSKARRSEAEQDPSALRRAAQYVRMSSEHQQYSIANQSAAIALYAAAHRLGVIRAFVDGGKTGTTIKRRTGLQDLLRIVESGTADFTDILVYDVSRWGRFPDSDESAHRIPSGKAILFNGRLGVIDLLYEYSSFSLIGSTSSTTCRSV